MAQYKTGTVNVTTGSAGVSGSGTAWLAEVNTGDLFAVLGDNCAYEIANVTANGTLGLTEPYRGTTATSKNYLIARDYTPFSGLPYLNEGDLEPHLILKRAMMKLDPFAGGAASENRAVAFEAEHNSDGSHKRHALLGTTLDTTGNAAVGGTLTLGGVARASWGEPVVAGTATSGAVGALEDTAMDWGSNALQNMVVAITAGQGTGQVRTVASNTATQLVPSTNFTTAPNATSTYAVYAMSNQTLSQVVEKEGALGCVGNLSSSALLDLNLASARAAMQSLGGEELQFLCESDTTHVDRYGVLQKNPFYSGTPTTTGANSITDTGASWTVNQLAGDNPYIIYLTDGSHTSYRWVRSNAATQVWWADPVPFTPTSYKISRPRFEKNGLLVEGASTNYVTNNTMSGAAVGTPGTLPTGWSLNLVGLTREVVAVGTLNGVDYIDLRLSGTPTGTQAQIYMAPAASHPTAAVGDAFTSSLYAALAGGSMTNINSVTNVVHELDVSYGYLISSSAVLTLGASLTRQSVTRTMNNASVAKSRNMIALSLNVGLAVDITLRIGMPQFEKLPLATSIIPTTSSVVTRSVTKSALSYANNMPPPTEAMSLIVEFDVVGIGTAVQRPIWIYGETHRGIQVANTSSQVVAYHSGNSVGTPLEIITADVPKRYGFTWDGTTLQGWAGGTKAGTPQTTTSITGSAFVIGIGESGGGTFQLNGHVKSAAIYSHMNSNVEMKLAS